MIDASEAMRLANDEFWLVVDCFDPGTCRPFDNMEWIHASVAAGTVFFNGRGDPLDIIAGNDQAAASALYSKITGV